MKVRHFADSGAGMFDAIFALIIEIAVVCTISLLPVSFFGRGKAWALLFIVVAGTIGTLISALFLAMLITGEVQISRQTESSFLYAAQILLAYIVVSMPIASTVTSIYLWRRARKP